MNIFVNEMNNLYMHVASFFPLQTLADIIKHKKLPTIVKKKVPNPNPIKSCS